MARRTMAPCDLNWPAPKGTKRPDARGTRPLTLAVWHEMLQNQSSIITRLITRCSPSLA